MTQDWSTWLDRLEASHAAQRTALAEGRGAGGHVDDAPPDLGPLPIALEARVRDLLMLNALLTAELSAACASAVRQLKLVGALQHRTVGASFLDTRG